MAMGGTPFEMPGRAHHDFVCGNATAGTGFDGIVAGAENIKIQKKRRKRE
jgi:hypothetical protein